MILGWLKKPISNKGLLWLIPAALVLILCNDICMEYAIYLLHWNSATPAGVTHQPPIGWITIWSLIYMAIGEEWCFRFLILRWAFKKKRGDLFIILCVICSSLAFGLVHGISSSKPHFYFGINFLLVQGISGMILSGVFLKAGDFGKRPYRGLFASSVVHLAINMSALGIMIAAGEKNFP